MYITHVFTIYYYIYNYCNKLRVISQLGINGINGLLIIKENRYTLYKLCIHYK